MALTSVALGILLVAGSAYALRAPILEAYYLRKLASEESLEREAAARELARRRSRRAVEPILRLYLEVEIHEASFDIPSPDPPKRNPYLDPLMELGGLAIPTLWNARRANSSLIEWRGLLSETLERVSGTEVESDPQLRALILEATRDPANEIRWQAARALARTAWLPPEAVPLLKSLLEDGSGEVRRAAAEALKRAPGG